jgi:hypothetical protein
MGIVGVHPGSFRKSGKHRSYSIPNLEECTEDGRPSCHKDTEALRGIEESEELKKEKSFWVDGCPPGIL